MGFTAKDLEHPGATGDDVEVDGYPLNVYRTMENHHVYQDKLTISMAMFNASM